MLRIDPLRQNPPPGTAPSSHDPDADLTRTAVVIETDAYLGLASGTKWTPEGFERAWRMSLDALERALRRPAARRAVLVLGIPAAGKSTKVAELKRAGDVILDESKLVIPERRAAAIAVARATGRPIEVIWVDTPLDICKARNAQRQGSRRVPDYALEKAAAFLRESPPTLAEGLARIRRVPGYTPEMQRGVVTT